MKRVLTIASIFLLIGSSAAQDDTAWDFIKGDIGVELLPLEERVIGRVRYEFTSISKTDSVFLDARNMQIQAVLLNGKKARYSYDGRALVIRKKLRPERKYDLEIEYQCQPAQALYFLGWNDSIAGNEQIWTQGQGKYSSHWVPSFDSMTEKVTFGIEIGVDKNYDVIANGQLAEIQDEGEKRIWRWQMNQPMSSYLLAFAVGNYDSKRIESGSGIPIDMYYYPGDSLRVEPTYRFSREVFNFFEKEIGVPYPWQNYKMVPVRDFLYAGMENTGTTLFSDAYVIDSTAFTDRNFVNVNAHELAHQWFGNLVTEVDASSHWLHEGFASYYAWLAEKEFLGEDEFYWMLYDKAEILSEQAREGRGESLLDPGASSLTFYDKGGLALLMLRKIMGEEAYRKTITDFLQTYSFKNVAVSDFTDISNTLSARDLKHFRESWLESTNFPYREVMDHLRRSYRPIDLFKNLSQELTTSPAEDESIIRRYWDTTDSEQFKKRVILSYHRSLSSEFLKKAFETRSTQVRQALSLIPGSDEGDLLPYYESLLDDDSYTTQENALYRLWLHHPDRRILYLEKVKDITGFPNKNIRQLWLLLAILTRDYGSDVEKNMYREELFAYTAPQFPMEVRQLAFSLIGEVFPYSRKNLKDLINAALYPSWQFRQFARNILKRELDKPGRRQQFELILNELRGEEYEYLKKELEN
ncbi:M1 family metallopeptidase [Muriicola marianensis]|nr:M1 family metallopeptidase [Muriicola marianensis]